MKRANGTGSIYKRYDDKRRRKPWVVVINLGMDPITFKRKKKILGSFATAKLAQAALDQFNCEPEKYEAAKTTVGEIWAIIYEQKKKANKDYKNYDSYWRNHVSILKNHPITEIRTMHMQQIIDKFDSYSPQKVIQSMFRWIFEYALANDLVNKDYSAFLKTMAMKHSDMHQPYTTEELRTLWLHTDSDLVKIILIQIYTGMRRGELVQMKMENVNLKENYMIGGSKTEAGINRTIPIAKCILPFVQHFYSISRFAHWPYLLMPDKQRNIGVWNGVVNLRNVTDKAMESLSLPRHLTHDARHTFVTMASNYSMDDTTLKRIVGHSRGSNVTQAVYTHKQIQQLIAAVNTLPYGPEMYISPEEKHMNSGSHVVAT